LVKNENLLDKPQNILNKLEGPISKYDQHQAAYSSRKKTQSAQITSHIKVQTKRKLLFQIKKELFFMPDLIFL
jgi:hypothetical protein